MAAAQQKQSIRRSTRVLQFCSCVLLGIGLLLVLPFAFITDTGLAGSFAGYFSLTAAASGLLGLYFTWQRGLVLFTVMTWTLSLETAIVMTQCVPPAQCPLSARWPASRACAHAVIQCMCCPMSVLHNGLRAERPISWRWRLPTGMCSATLETHGPG